MPARWNPRDVLEVDTLDDKFTCTGITQKCQRCRNRVNIEDRRKADSLLNEMAMLRPESAQCARMLKELASLTLCKRWHRGPQTERTCSRWEDLIDDYVSSFTTVTRTSSITQQNTRASSAARSGLSMLRTELAHQSTSAARARNLPALQPLPRAGSRHSSQNTPAIQALESDHNPELPLIAIPTRSTTSGSHVRGARQASPPSTQDRLPLTSTTIRDSLTEPIPRPRQETSSSRTAQDAPSPSTPASSAHVHDEEHNPHTRQVVRQPVTDCPICYEGICCEHSAVWCRGQCGQNVHKSCFAQWRLTVTRDAEARRMDEREGPPQFTVKCVYCRAPWVED